MKDTFINQIIEIIKEFGKMLAVAVSASLALFLAGCGTTQKLAEGISEKSLSGSGTVSIQRVGIDDETKTPVLKSTVITGDYASARNGDYAFQYRRKMSPSIFNTSAVTEEVTINYIGTKKQALEALKLAEKDVKNADGEIETPEAVTPAENMLPAADGTAAEKSPATTGQSPEAVK